MFKGYRYRCVCGNCYFCCLASRSAACFERSVRRNRPFFYRIAGLRRCSKGNFRTVRHLLIRRNFRNRGYRTVYRRGKRYRVFGNGRSIYFKDSFYPHRLCYRQFVSWFVYAGVGSVTFPFYKLVTAKLSCSKGKFSVLIYHTVFRQCRYHRYITAGSLFDRYLVLRSRRLAFVAHILLTAEKHYCSNKRNASTKYPHKRT